MWTDLLSGGALRSHSIWLAIGFAAQTIFASRFLVQWIASERAKESMIPVSFWYLSIIGSLMLLCYALYRRDPVFVLGQGMGTLIYMRNLVLIRRSRAAAHPTTSA